MLPLTPSSPYCLFLDIDGTLLDIAETPDGVLVPETLREALATLNRKLDGAVALVSGRAIGDIDGLFAPLRLRASGVHGAEIRFDPDGPVQVSPGHLLPASAVTALRAIAARHPGTLVEDKRYSVAIHYRAVPMDGADLRVQLETFLHSPAGQGFRILPGHMVFEIKRSGFDKGTAVAALAATAPFHGRRPIFIGDDVTDLPAFERVLTAGGLAFAVTTPRPGASGHFPDPRSVRVWLDEVAAASM